MDYFIINGHLSWLPETIFVHLFAASKEFIEARKRSLKRFLTLVVRHPVLCEDKIVNFFLTVKGSVSCPVEFYWNTPFQQSSGFVMVASICFCCLLLYLWYCLPNKDCIIPRNLMSTHVTTLLHENALVVSRSEAHNFFHAHYKDRDMCFVKDMCAISPRTLVRS